VKLRLLEFATLPRISVAVAAVSLFGLDLWHPARMSAPGAALPATGATPSRPPAASSPCPSGMLSDYGVCIVVPQPMSGEGFGSARLQLVPGRPLDYARYRTPVRSPQAPLPGPGGSLFVAAPPGTPVEVVALDAQAGAARLLFVSPTRVITLHRVARNGATSSYVLLYEGLNAAATGPATELAPGSRLGTISPSPRLATGLRLAVRQVRAAIDAEQVPVDRLLSDSHSVECDPRNVLALRPN
jgi:hypothetical protein